MNDQSDRIGPAAGANPSLDSIRATQSKCAEINVDIVVQDDVWNAITQRETCVGEAMRALAEIIPVDGPLMATLALSNDAHVAQLNSTYRSKAGATNVLSFPADERARQLPSDPSDCEYGAHARYLGDIIMAYETVSAEAQAMQIPIIDHFCHLLVHGMLHLMGHDHETDADAAGMESLEVKILASLGISDPYDSERAI